MVSSLKDLMIYSKNDCFILPYKKIFEELIEKPLEEKNILI